MNYLSKYNKYKNKYLELKQMIGTGSEQEKIDKLTDTLINCIKGFYTAVKLPIINNVQLIRENMKDNLFIELLSPDITIHIQNNIIKITQYNKQIYNKSISDKHMYIFFKIILYLFNNSFYTHEQVINIIDFINTNKINYIQYIKINNTDNTDTNNDICLNISELKM